MSHHDRIDPLKKVTLASMIADKLRELVVQGAYEPGEQLNEVELATRFGVSRGPVREGLRELVHQGLLRTEPHRGVFVLSLSNDDIADIYHAREAIETAAVKAIFEGGQPAEVGSALGKVVQSMQRAFTAREWSRLADYDMRFHMELVRGSGSRRLSRMYSTLLDEARMSLRLTMTEPREDVVQEHFEIAAKLETGDLEGTLAALTRHLQDSPQTIGGASTVVEGAA